MNGGNILFTTHKIVHEKKLLKHRLTTKKQ